VVTIRLDADVLAWFKARSPKYQTAVNSVLREFVRRHSDKPMRQFNERARSTRKVSKR